MGTPDGKRPLGRSRRRWEDNIKIIFHEVGYEGGLIWFTIVTGDGLL
jgi:hypothetical protein